MTLAPPSTSTSPWHEATVVRIAPLTPRIVSVFLKAPVRPPIAGQHLVVRLTAPDGYAAQRSYSIASSPKAELVELVIEKFEDGEVSPFFHEVVQPGDVIEVRGPLGGHFVWHPEDGGPLLLVGGGSGIAPLMAMLRAWRDAASSTPVLLLMSGRSWDDLAFRNELIALQASSALFGFVVATTRESARRPGDLGRRFDAAALQMLLRQWGHAPQQVYLCGANRFVEAMAIGLTEAGVPAARIRTERYGGAG